MSEQDIEIDVSMTKPYEAGAIVLAHLALPNGTEEARGGLIFSLCNRALRAKYDLASSEAHSEQLLKPIYVFRAENQIGKDFRTFDRRLRDRLIAADMAIALLKEATGTLPATLPEGLRTLSLNELSAWAGRKLPESRKKGAGRDQGDIETRIWRESLPVIHFAVALANFTQTSDRQRQGKLHPVEMVLKPEFVKWLITYAEQLAEIIERTGIRGKKAKPLIRIRLVGEEPSNVPAQGTAKT